MSALNRKMFSFADITPVPDELVAKSRLQKAMIFELSMARAEGLLRGDQAMNWDECLQVASKRQQQHYDAKIPDKLEWCDIAIADHAAQNLVAMLNSVQAQHPAVRMEHAPLIPGLGWVASGNGDFALGSMLIEIKHTEQNFRAGDFRQVLMYWLLKYARSVESNVQIWSEVLLMNPRRNTALLLNYEYLLRSASAGSNRVELIELLRSAVGQDFDRR
ncbi:hypothetical protein AB4144_02630 [Rhizobiaceae sp. 2RAB30]